MEQAQKTSEVNTTSQQADKLKEAAELIKADLIVTGKQIGRAHV